FRFGCDLRGRLGQARHGRRAWRGNAARLAAPGRRGGQRRAVLSSGSGDRAAFGAAGGSAVERKKGGIPVCCGVFREVEHSPGREADDAAILKATGRRLEEKDGFVVDYRAPSEVTGRERVLPALVFSMCEGRSALENLGRWESRGACVVN